MICEHETLEKGFDSQEKVFASALTLWRAGAGLTKRRMEPSD
jgi:hypothetical protein